MRRGAAIALIALAAAALPGSAGADYFAHTREARTAGQPTIHIEIMVREGLVARIEGTAPNRCHGFDSSGLRFEFPGLDVKIRADGRFRWIERHRPAGGASLDAMVGRVSDRRVIGRFASRVFIPSEFRCWTGAGWGDPWVRFVAHRQRRP